MDIWKKMWVGVFFLNTVYNAHETTQISCTVTTVMLVQQYMHHKLCFVHRLSTVHSRNKDLSGKSSWWMQRGGRVSGMGVPQLPQLDPGQSYSTSWICVSRVYQKVWQTLKHICTETGLRLPYQNTGKTTLRQIIVPFHSVRFLSHFINDSNNSSKSQFMIVTTHRMFISCWVFKYQLIP